MLKVAIILLLFLFSGCTCTPEIQYLTQASYKFKKIEQPKKRTIRIHNDDKILYNAYIKRFRDIIDFHDSQIDDYFKAKGKQ